jgi:hypothetical protein
MEVPGPRPQVIATVGIAAALTTVGSVRIRVSAPLWPVWLSVAIEQERRAREARAAGERIVRAGSDSFGEAMGQELRAAIVAVSASAYAIDALYGVVEPLIPLPAGLPQTWARTGASRHARIRGTLAHGFALDNATGKRWKREFTWLFDLRDGAVHYEEGLRDPVPHPLGGNTAPEYVYYSVESVERAVSLGLEVFSACARAPRPALGELVKWGTGAVPIVARLLAERSGG